MHVQIMITCRDWLFAMNAWCHAMPGLLQRWRRERRRPRCKARHVCESRRVKSCIYAKIQATATASELSHMWYTYIDNGYGGSNKGDSTCVCGHLRQRRADRRQQRTAMGMTRERHHESALLDLATAKSLPSLPRHQQRDEAHGFSSSHGEG